MTQRRTLDVGDVETALQLLVEMAEGVGIGGLCEQGHPQGELVARRIGLGVFAEPLTEDAQACLGDSEWSALSEVRELAAQGGLEAPDRFWRLAWLLLEGVVSLGLLVLPSANRPLGVGLPVLEGPNLRLF
ncbi:MAG: hypothetical protein Q8N23_12655 [Archangium sp.]|nr:hypothetical protein [Archangium sp.]MDP3153521.1 hypothetical protein [Archangium sp.]MDP3574555.1 hypothetical protein [Archangium sp.]